jgi:hypothetical protein
MTEKEKELPPDTTTKNKENNGNLFSFNRFLLKVKYSLYSAIVFFVFANPETLIILQRFLGRFIDFITPSGAPTITGIFASTGLFFITMLGLMLLPSE